LGGDATWYASFNRDCNAEVPISSQFCPHCSARSPLAYNPLAALDSGGVSRDNRPSVRLDNQPGFRSLIGLGVLLFFAYVIKEYNVQPPSSTLEAKVSQPTSAPISLASPTRAWWDVPPAEGLN
jgi:hypothetical protein